MTLKMQRGDAVSGFSFLFPARYSPVEDAICPAGQRALDPRLVELQKSPREPGALLSPGSRQRLWLLPSRKSPPRRCPSLLPVPGARGATARRVRRHPGCPSRAAREAATQAVWTQQEP